MQAFDVLIVYSSPAAYSATNKAYLGTSPFSVESAYGLYNAAYAYFLETCARVGLSAAFTTSSDIIGAGICRCYWSYVNNKWTKVNEHAHARNVFDKFSAYTPANKISWQKLFSSRSIRPFNDPTLTSLFNDKLLTGRTFSSYALPTILVRATHAGVREAVAQLRALTARHHTPQDFTSAIILKDRYGAGGELIFKIINNFEKEIYTLLKTHERSSFVLQPFLKFTQGFTFDNITSATDIRLIYHRGELIQTYIRRAKKHDFRCNAHQGGSSTYITNRDIPVKIRDKARHIMKELNYNPSLFTLDFAMSDSGQPYLLEGNISPGLYWDPTSRTEERMSKRLIMGIVHDIAQRVHTTFTSNLLAAYSPSPVAGTV